MMHKSYTFHVQYFDPNLFPHLFEQGNQALKKKKTTFQCYKTKQ